MSAVHLHESSPLSLPLYLSLVHTLSMHHSNLPDENALNTGPRSSGARMPYPSYIAENPQAIPEKAAEERVLLGLKVGGKRHAETMKQIQSDSE